MRFIYLLDNNDEPITQIIYLSRSKKGTSIHFSCCVKGLRNYTHTHTHKDTHKDTHGHGEVWPVWKSWWHNNLQGTMLHSTHSSPLRALREGGRRKGGGMERWEDRELRRKREGERTRVEEGTEKWTERQDEEVIRRGRGGKVQEERGGEGGGGGGWHSGGKRKRSVCLRHICSGGELPDSHQTPAEWQSPLLSQVAAFFFFFSSPPSLFCLFWEENTSPHSPCAASLRKNSQCGVIFTPGNPSFQRQYELPVSLYGRSQYRVISVDKLLQSNRCSAGDMNWIQSRCTWCNLQPSAATVLKQGRRDG